MVGTVCVVFLFLALLYKGFQIALHCRRPYLRMIAIGVSFQLTMQAFINIGVVTAMTPSKGIPLPFISYGGTSIIFSLAAIGLLMNVAEANVAIREAAREPVETQRKKREGATLTSSGEDSLEAVSSGVWEEKAAGQRLSGSEERMPRPAVEPGLVMRGDWSERRRKGSSGGGEKRSRGGRG